MRYIGSYSTAHTRELFSLNAHMQHCNNTYQAEYSNSLSIRLKVQTVHPVFGCVCELACSLNTFSIYSTRTDYSLLKHVQEHHVLLQTLVWERSVTETSLRPSSSVWMGFGWVTCSRMSSPVGSDFCFLPFSSVSAGILHHPNPFPRGYLHLWVIGRNWCEQGSFVFVILPAAV